MPWSEVAKVFRRRRFFDLSDRDKRDLLKLMARVAEQAYRRGVQQGAGLAGVALPCASHMREERHRETVRTQQTKVVVALDCTTREE